MEEYNQSERQKKVPVRSLLLMKKIISRHDTRKIYLKIEKMIDG